MLIRIPEVLTADELTQARQILAEAAWKDGKSTAGTQALQAKNNEQLSQDSPESERLRALVLKALERHPLFFSAALPKKIYPPLFNRYGGDTNFYGNHVDGAVMQARQTGQRIRSDVSCTLFLAEPEDYDGGDLAIEDTYGTQRVKLAAGDMVLYPSTSIHRVEPVTRGHRVACFFWVESMVRSDEQRRMLFDLDMNLLRLREAYGESSYLVNLTGTYHNLLRMWADT
ncbi:Fe2+-dependent dioxygenase [Aquabacterium sp.]|uniref:Fe2+-dependent dioxygenase n=1 Tax=Aquabacterium sp. TaxID=1872578 RepID=UPI0035AF777E